METDRRMSAVLGSGSRSVWPVTSGSGFKMDWGGVGARVGSRGQPDPNRAPALGDGGGGPVYAVALSGRGDSDLAAVLPGGASSFFVSPSIPGVTSSFREYLAELDRTKPDLTGDREGDLDAAGVLIRICREEVERVTNLGGVMLPSILIL